jgi:uncharacterized protein with FMN-binding domain
MKRRTLAITALSATAAAGLTTAAPAALARTAKPTKYVGPTVETKYGPIQVTITVSKKKITAITIANDPQDPRSEQVESQAIPILRSEGLKAQSWRVHIVSGATTTSEAFASSMYSAMKHADLL